MSGNDEQLDIGRKPVLYRAKYYFIRGHQQWWYIPLMLGNILIIFYGIGGQVMPVILEIFPTFTSFVLLTAPLYVVLCGVTGWWDFKRGAFKTEQEVWWEDNPLTNLIREEFERLHKRIDEFERELRETSGI